MLCLIGFVATGFVITITLSAADATAHVVENPFTRFLQGTKSLTLLLIALLGAVFLKGFSEAINLAVFMVVSYILLNVVVVVEGFYQIARRPQVFHQWSDILFGVYDNPLLMIGAALILFPAGARACPASKPV